MSTDRTKPYIEGKAGDLLTASMWNAAQVAAKQDIAAEVAAAEARLKDQIVAGSAELKTGALKADTGSVGKLSVGDLEITGGVTMGSAGGWAPRLYVATAKYGEGGSYGSGLSWSSSDQYVGPYFTLNSNNATGYWGWGGPVLTLKLGTTSLVQLSARWLWWLSTASNYYRWAQFIVGYGSKFAPVRTHPGSYAGENSASSNYSRPSDPNASNFLTASTGWLDYHHNYYSSYSRWPMAGLTHYACRAYDPNNGNWVYNHIPVQHTEMIELPAGTFTVHMGFSGYYQNIGNLQLQALVFPGGSMG